MSRWPKVKKFEETFVTTFGWTDGVDEQLGLIGQSVAVAALANPATKDGLKPGDEVIVPALLWSTTVWPVIQWGCAGDRRHRSRDLQHRSQ